jgi:hypothetical protein
MELKLRHPFQKISHMMIKIKILVKKVYQPTNKSIMTLNGTPAPANPIM